MADKYVFLDRDGVINRDGHGVTETGYVIRREEFEFLPGVLEALGKLRGNGFKCYVVSNQQCVGKGLCSMDDLNALTSVISFEVEKKGGSIDGFYYCPHAKEEKCSCRKPATGLFDKAKEELGIKDPGKFYFIGDSERDMQAGKNAGLNTILVLSGKTREKDVENYRYKPDHVCYDLLEATDIVIKSRG